MQATPPRAPRYLSLDLLRGCSCLAVAIYHIAVHDRRLIAPSWILQTVQFFWLGVPLFFVISGYCIAATCDSASRAHRSLSWYMRRRLRRIFPPYWACLVAVCALSLLHVHMQGIGNIYEMTVPAWIGNLTLTERWRTVVTGGTPLLLLAPAWTLCYEEQFYVLSGLLLKCGARGMWHGVLGLSALTLPIATAYWSGCIDVTGLFVDGYWLHFAAGMAVYYARNYARGASYAAILIMLGLGVAAMLVLRTTTESALIHGYSRWGYFNSTAFALAVAIGLIALGTWDDCIYRWPYSAPLRFVGVRCYSLYLTHEPVIAAIRQLADRPAGGGQDGSHGEFLTPGRAMGELACCIAVAALFYHLVERHFVAGQAQLSTNRSGQGGTGR